MKIIREVFMLAIVVIFFFPFLSLGAEPEDPHDPRWIKYSPWVNPKGTYLRTCNDNPLNATRLDMNDYGIFYGDWIIISSDGDYLHIPNAATATKSMSAVFSTSTRLLPDEVTQQHRVPGAVPIPDGGVANYTNPTWFECKEDEDDEDEIPTNLITDIPEDFLRGGSNFVKVSARYLFVSARARWFSDNIDPEMDYRVKFTDETSWDQDSTICTTCWNDPDNWSEERVPTSDLGVTFGRPGFTEVTAYDGAIIKYLRIVDGAVVEFESDGVLQTTVDSPEKYSFIVDGAKMYWTNGFFLTDIMHIGYQAHGTLEIHNGSTVIVHNIVRVADFPGGSGIVLVDGRGSTLDASIISVADEGSGNLLISNGGYVSANLIGVGDGGAGTGFGWINVTSGGKLSGSRMIIKDRGNLVINQADVNMSDGIQVYTGGGIRGCDTGFITGNVINMGGFVEPGCSPGKLTIDGNYIQETEGTLEIEVGGYQPEQEYDILEVTGDATLDGILQLDFINGFAPKKGDVFEFLQIGGTATGSFSNVVIKGLKDGFEYDIKIEGGVSKLIALNDGVSSKFPWPMFLPAITGAAK